MAEELPTFIDIRRFLDGPGEVSGSVAPRLITRLPEPFKPASPLELTLRLEAGEAGSVRLSGQIRTEVEAICQRCLNDMRVAITRTVDVVLVSDEPPGTETDGSEDDFIVVDDGHWRLIEFAEDELILACPMIPTHAPADCPVQIDESVATDERQQPFAGLADLMAKDRHDAGD